MKVFEMLDQPYFAERGRETPWKREDWIFFLKLHHAGIDAYVYPDIQCGHQDRETGEIYYFSEKKDKILKTTKAIH